MQHGSFQIYGMLNVNLHFKFFYDPKQLQL
jgi:hypothetical protein